MYFRPSARLEKWAEIKRPAAEIVFSVAKASPEQREALLNKLIALNDSEAMSYLDEITVEVKYDPSWEGVKTGEKVLVYQPRVSVRGWYVSSAAEILIGLGLLQQPEEKTVATPFPLIVGEPQPSQYWDGNWGWTEGDPEVALDFVTA